MTRSQAPYAETRTLGGHLFTEAERDRFRAKFSPGCGPQDCWEWQASALATGYGQMHFRGRPHAAHHLSFFEFWGQLPDGCDAVMHLCDNRRCVNPFHLRPGTNALNVWDRERKGRNRIEVGQAVACANRKARTHCKNGHEFTSENTRLYQPRDRPGPTRICLACKRASRSSSPGEEAAATASAS